MSRKHQRLRLDNCPDWTEFPELLVMSTYVERRGLRCLYCNAVVLDSTEDGAHYRSWAHWDLVAPQLYVHTGGYSRVSDEFARRVKDKTGARGGCGTLVAIGRALETPALAPRLATLPAPTAESKAARARVLSHFGFPELIPRD